MASAEAVPVIEQLKEILDAYKATGSAEGRIFRGKIESWTKHPMRPAIRRAGLRWTGWHGFRRGLATTLNDLGVPLLTIQAIMRHSSPEITEQAYVKRLPKQSLAAMDEFERAVESESRNVQ
jgi:integrase